MNTIEIICARCHKPALRSKMGSPKYCLPCAREINHDADKARMVRARHKAKKLKEQENNNAE